MKRFLLFAGLFLCLFIVIDRSLALFMDRIFQTIRTGDHGGKINQYFALPDVPGLVIMGSSRVAHQIIPGSFGTPAFNLGHDGMYQPFQTGLLRMMEQKNKLPKIILLQLDPYEFMGELVTRDVQNLKYYYHKSDTLRDYIDRLSFFEKYKYYADLYRYNGRTINIVRTYLTDRNADPPGDGYEMFPVSGSDSLNTLYAGNNDREIPGLRFNLRQVRYLDSFIAICKRNNVRLVCFTAPFFNPPRYFHEGALHIAARLDRDKIPYINFERTPIVELHDHPRYWRDSRHLNHQGAKILSERLAKDLKSLVK